MTGRGQVFRLAGRALAVLLVLSSCGDAYVVATAATELVSPVAERSQAPDGPVVVDIQGAPLTAEHAEVVRSVHRALAAGDLEALRGLYAGDDWAGQVKLLSVDSVRHSVLDALRTTPANLGEGYLYPGGYPGSYPGSSAGPVYQGYQTAFFLDDSSAGDSPDGDPSAGAAGPLRWRGIAPPGPALTG